MDKGLLVKNQRKYSPIQSNKVAPKVGLVLVIFRKVRYLNPQL